MAGRSSMGFAAGAWLAVAAVIVVGWLASYTNTSFIASRGVLYVVRVPPDQPGPNRLSVDAARWLDDGSIRLTIAQLLGGPSQMYISYRPLEEDAPRWQAPGLRFWDGTGFTKPIGNWPIRRVRVQVLAVGYGWLLAAVALYPAVRLTRLAVRSARGRRRHHANRCAACGYDVRATPERCPECGAVPESAQPAA